MHKVTGEIIEWSDLELKKKEAKDEQDAKKLERLNELFMKMTLPPTSKQRRTGKVGRNDPCPCDSGKKFKKCCILKVQGPTPQTKEVDRGPS